MFNNCLICGAKLNRDSSFCAACAAELPLLGNHCCWCAEPLPDGNYWCGNCLQHSAKPVKLYVPYRYAFPISELILQLKFAAKLDYARDLAELLVHFLKIKYRDDHYPELLLPIPLSKRRMTARGYNQAGEIARFVDKSLRIAVNWDDLVRIHDTVAQTTLDHKERAQNLRGAFAWCGERLLGSHLALIDDVITTGSTVHEAAKTLMQAGAARVDIWCCAKTLLL